jgi:DHA2 family multidrug resistance protein-like MFS transporter
MEVTPPHPGPRATRKEWIGLVALALPCLLYAMDLTVLNLAVPHLTADLKPSSAELLWIIDIYGFVLAGALIPMGVLGDRIGRRKLLLIGAAFFGGASILAAFAHSVPFLIAARACLGVAAATLAPSTLSLIRNMFLDDKERTFAIGIWISSFSAGGAIGPVLGGLLLEYFWWGSVFLLNVPIMALLLVIGPKLLPEYRDEKAGRPDIPSALLSLGTVLAVIYGIKRLAQEGLTHPQGIWQALLVILGGLVIGFFFVRRQNRLAVPFVDLSLFRNRAFSAALGVNIASVFAAFGSWLFVAQYIQLVMGLTPLEAGLWSSPSGFAFIAASMLTPQFLKVARPAYVMGAGLLLTALSFALIAQAGNGASPREDIALVVTAFVVMSLGLSPVFTLTTDLIVGAVPPERAGVASGMAETSAEFGGALGIAVLGSVMTALYRHGLGEVLPPDLPAQAAAAARDTLGGALATADTLAPAAGAALAAAARAVYIDAFQIISWTCAALTFVAAFVAMRALRDARPGSHGSVPEAAACADAAQ